ncbi:protein SUPPRESSOR OF QUENCHING 1, chloroplastic-like isoform X1 [Solanum pennellii]|uniref:Protein SUPPRESSOR OF QUENCHING 1, chloroplastic-like isoform X1 n=1 Tax=Solanum pennellii TaxID=28526 RepID=A0ABM1V567_SOLPN|nr:protein SUPPRESSOR OF QUENCHING 1, chloroplastic-like isoform X1 [Solanum pennellii]
MRSRNWKRECTVCFAIVRNHQQKRLWMLLLRWVFKLPLKILCLSWAWGVEGFDAEAAKKRFFEIYLLKAIICSMQTVYGIGVPGAFELFSQCKSSGLKVAVASSAYRIKVDAKWLQPVYQ